MIRLTCMFAAVLLLLSPAPSVAGEATETVKTAQRALLEGLAEPASAARDQRIEARMDALFDFHGMAAATLGDQWSAWSAAGKAEYTALFARLVRKHYRRTLEGMLGRQVTYLAEEEGRGEQRGSVRVRVRAKALASDKAEPPRIDLRLHKPAGKLKVVDVYTDGVGLVDSYRARVRPVAVNEGQVAAMLHLQRELDKD
ncbi:MAG: ABC transporter substrate-binding protein [Myxococcales bacterium]|nr:ABC transporter substrate-binding protein [Myxococcales bacterium]